MGGGEAITQDHSQALGWNAANQKQPPECLHRVTLIAGLEREHARKCLALTGACAVAIGGGLEKAKPKKDSNGERSGTH